MYPVQRARVAPNGAYLCGVKMKLQTSASLTAALTVMLVVRPELILSDADTALWRKGTPQLVTTRK